MAGRQADQRQLSSPREDGCVACGRLVPGSGLRRPGCARTWRGTNPVHHPGGAQRNRMAIALVTWVTGCCHRTRQPAGWAALDALGLADKVMKSRDHQDSKYRPGVPNMLGSKSVPLPGVAAPLGVLGA